MRTSSILPFQKHSPKFVLVGIFLFSLLLPELALAQSKSTTPVDQRFLPGCRAMIVDAGAVKPVAELTELTTYPTQVVKVVAHTENELIIRGFDGFGSIPVTGVILLRRLDAKEAINSRFTGKERKLALAEFANLHDTSESLSLYRELIESDPDYVWPRVRMASLLLQYNMVGEVETILEPIKENSPAWNIRQVQLAINSGNVEERIEQILAEDSDNIPALKVQARLQTLQASDRSLETADRMQFASALAATLEILEDALPCDSEVAKLRLKMLMIGQQMGLNFSVEDQMTVVKAATDALKLDPFSPDLLIAISHALQVSGRFNAATSIAKDAAENFPRHADAVSSFSLIAWEQAAETLQLDADPAVTAFALSYHWPEVSEGIDRIASLDIPRTTSHLPFRIVDGDGRKNSGFLLDKETGLTALQVLCALDSVDTLRFLDDKYENIDYRFGEVDGVTLAHVCTINDSFNSLAFLMNNNVPFDLADSEGLRPIDYAIDRKSAACVQLLWKSGQRPTAGHLKALCSWLDCQTVQLPQELAAAAVDVMVEDFELRNGDALVEIMTARLLHKLGKMDVESAQQLRALGVGSGETPSMPAPVFVPSTFKDNPHFVRRAIQEAADQSLPAVTQQDREKWDSLERAGVGATIDAKHKFEFFSRRLGAARIRAELVAESVLEQDDLIIWRNKIDQLDDSPAKD